MELSFVIAALRRRFWVVTLFALLGSLPGLTTDSVTSDMWVSTSVLSVQSPTRTNLNVFSSNPDRYVLSQLSVLESESLAAEVVNEVNLQPGGSDLTVADLRATVDIKHKPETDIVTITSTTDDPKKAAFISQTYATLYVAGLATTATDVEQRAALEKSIETLTNRLDGLDQRLKDAMAPWLPRKADATPDPIPPPDIIDPAAVSQRQLTQAELTGLIGQRNEIDLQSRLQVNTEILSDAPEPEQPLPPRGNFLLAGGLLSGAILGVIVALMWARFSTKVLDEVSAGDILGAPVVSEFPHYRSLSRNPLAAFQALPRSAVPTVDQLCVRAEALARIGEPLVVAVTGTMRSAGSTTLALAMAERFAAGGASVVVIDGDVRDPRVTALFNATADGGVPSVIANDGALTDHRGRSAFTRTMDPAVSVLGLGPNRGSAALRRDTVPAVLGAARRKAEIVVVDGGPVLDLASTIHFASLADAVVLALPLARQKADALLDLARQLGSVSTKLLPVVTSPSRRAARGEVVGSDGAIVMPGPGSPVPFGANRPVAAAEGPVIPSTPGSNGAPPAAATTTSVLGGEARPWVSDGNGTLLGVPEPGMGNGHPARPVEPGQGQPPSR